MPAQGTALGIGSGVENSNALKGQNRFAVKDPQGRPRKRGSPRLGFSVSAPTGQQKSATPELRKGGKAPLTRSPVGTDAGDRKRGMKRRRHGGGGKVLLGRLEQRRRRAKGHEKAELRLVVAE